MSRKFNADAVALFAVLTVMILSLAPVSPIVGGVGRLDVVFHGLAYGVVCACAVARRRSLWSAVSIFAVVVLFGGLIELIQPLFGRASQVHDLIANVIGSAIGLIMALVYKVVMDPTWK